MREAGLEHVSIPVAGALLLPFAGLRSPELGDLALRYVEQSVE